MLFRSVVHFACLNVGVIALVRPLELDSASRFVHLPVAAASPAVFVALFALRGGLGRIEGVTLLAFYAAYLAVAIAVSA